MAVWPSARLVMANSVPLVVFLLLAIIIAAQPNMLAAAAEESQQNATLTVAEERWSICCHLLENLFSNIFPRFTMTVCNGLAEKPENGKPSRRFQVENKEKQPEAKICFGSVEELQALLADGAFVDDMKQIDGMVPDGEECLDLSFTGITKPPPTTEPAPSPTTTMKPKIMLSVPLTNKTGEGLYLESALKANWQELTLKFFQADMQPLFTFYGTSEKCKTDDTSRDCLSVVLIPAQGRGNPLKFELPFKKQKTVIKFHMEIRDETNINFEVLPKAPMLLPLNEPISEIMAFEQEGHFVGNFTQHSTMQRQEGIIVPFDKQIEQGKSLIIPWMLLSKANITIKMISFKPNEANISVEDAAPCFKEETELSGDELTLKKSEDCMIVLDIDIKMKKIGSVKSEKWGITGHKIWQDENEEKKMKSLEKNMIINAVTCKVIDATITGEADAFMVDQVLNMKPVINSKSSVTLVPVNINMIWVSIGESFLFANELKVETTVGPSNGIKDCAPLIKA